MSKLTNPLEISVTCGFFDSISGDRKYSAQQMSSIFDGIIRDGIFQSIGGWFFVSGSDEENTVKVAPGKAWFNHTWITNSAELPIVCEPADPLLNRIDAIVIEINNSQEVRDNSIKFIKGEGTSSTPSRPALTNTSDVKQYALCYIYRKAADDNIISTSKITNAIGVEEGTPFVTGVLEILEPDVLASQWTAKLDEFLAFEQIDVEAFMTQMENDFNAWWTSTEAMNEVRVADLDAWTNTQKQFMLNWFEGMQDQLSEDAAINLQMQIDKDEIRDILINGLSDGTKTISADGMVITSVDSIGRTLTKTFTNEFTTSTSILLDQNGIQIGSLIKTLSSDGLTITSEMTI